MAEPLARPAPRAIKLTKGSLIRVQPNYLEPIVFPIFPMTGTSKKLGNEFKAYCKLLKTTDLTLPLIPSQKRRQALQRIV